MTVKWEEYIYAPKFIHSSYLSISPFTSTFDFSIKKRTPESKTSTYGLNTQHFFFLLILFRDFFFAGKFTPPLFHPNIFESGHICLSILKEEKGWRSSISIKELLMGIQDLLTEPNAHDPAQCKANEMYCNHRSQYSQRIRKQAKQFATTTNN